MDALLLYAVYPGATNVDQMIAERHLYRAYIPIYNALGEAGWEVVPYATVTRAIDAKGAMPWCERFGNRQAGYFFAVRNPGEAGEMALSLDLAKLGIENCAFTAICGCEVKSADAGRVVVTMPAQWTGVIAVNRGNAEKLAQRHAEEMTLFRGKPGA